MKRCVVVIFLLSISLFAWSGSSKGNSELCCAQAKDAGDCAYKFCLTHLKVNEDLDSVETKKVDYQDIAETRILPHVDMNTLSMKIAGKRWKNASSQDKEKFLAIMKVHLLKNYLEHLPRYQTGGGKMRAWRQSSTGGRSVKSFFGKGVPVEYSLAGNTGCKVYDINANYISVIELERADLKQGKVVKIDGKELKLDTLANMTAYLKSVVKNKK